MDERLTGVSAQRRGHLGCLGSGVGVPRTELHLPGEQWAVTRPLKKPLPLWKILLSLGSRETDEEKRFEEGHLHTQAKQQQRGWKKGSRRRRRSSPYTALVSSRLLYYLSWKLLQGSAGGWTCGWLVPCHRARETDIYKTSTSGSVKGTWCGSARLSPPPLASAALVALPCRRPGTSAQMGDKSLRGKSLLFSCGRKRAALSPDRRERLRSGGPAELWRVQHFKESKPLLPSQVTSQSWKAFSHHPTDV